MPRIIITADESGGRVLLSERVTPSDFETEHFRAQLAERVAWAVEDAASDQAGSKKAKAGSEAGRAAPAHAA